SLETLTNTELGLTLGAAVVVAAAVLVVRKPPPAYGLWPALLLLAFALLSVISIVWSVQPDASWRDAARLLCYAAVFAAAGAIAAWDFSNHALSSENVPVAEATSAGHELGALVITMVLLLSAVGIGVTFATGRRAPSALMRRRAGIALACLAGVLVLAFLG